MVGSSWGFLGSITGAEFAKLQRRKARVENLGAPPWDLLGRFYVDRLHDSKFRNVCHRFSLHTLRLEISNFTPFWQLEGEILSV